MFVKLIKAYFGLVGRNIAGGMMGFAFPVWIGLVFYYLQTYPQNFLPDSFGGWYLDLILIMALLFFLAGMPYLFARLLTHRVETFNGLLHGSLLKVRDGKVIDAGRIVLKGRNSKIIPVILPIPDRSIEHVFQIHKIVQSSAKVHYNLDFSIGLSPVSGLKCGWFPAQQIYDIVIRPRQGHGFQNGRCDLNAWFEDRIEEYVGTEEFREVLGFLDTPAGGYEEITEYIIKKKVDLGFSNIAYIHLEIKKQTNVMYFRIQQ